MQELKPDKGVRNGSCNRTCCQKPGANYWNRSTRKWYCSECAYLINKFRGNRMGYPGQDEHTSWKKGDVLVVYVLRDLSKQDNSSSTFLQIPDTDTNPFR